ncbi:PREDICTED: uncharacterized protein LOC107095507 [Cyprinodon variegatus]|uniref:uncharacterized protein LOC107095507 n=1 Tax=Cyprinodon variegatus TaxID=28743 RepID=UPI000742B62C|nr:PREDICTED: uncharacterized protein LOC107095507 [Cyprinodon variegatus]
MRKESSKNFWCKVGRVECVIDLKKRLSEASEIKINLETDASGLNTEPPALETEKHLMPCEEDAASAAPAAITQSAMPETKSELSNKLPEPPKAEITSTSEESQPCENSLIVEVPDKKSQTSPESGSVSSVSVESTEASLSVRTEATAKELVQKEADGLDFCLTPGERIGSLLHPQKICCLPHHVIMSPKIFSFQTRLLLITNLPQYQDGCYTESGISNLLYKFGFQYEEKNMYVIPQARMAFVLMPCYRKAREAFLAAKDGLSLNGSKLGVEIISNGIIMIPFGFYKSLMLTINHPVHNDGSSTIYIHNITMKETRELRETLRKMDSVKNFLPLLNKVFIEFKSALDADLFGIQFSLLKNRPPHNIYRMKLSKTSSSPPRLAIPDLRDMVVGPVLPLTDDGVPEGSTAPFFITMATAPFLFPTTFLCYIIPKFRTINTEEDLSTLESVASKFSTVMLTGLPEANFKHQDVAKLVWEYLPQQDLQTLFYSIVVLPLQRRHVPELQCLQERLVCVELSETSVDLINCILTAVANISPIVNFLSLANRLCIEMAESSGVNLVVSRLPDAAKAWNNVPRVESVSSLKQRLKDFGPTKLGLDLDTKDTNAKPSATKSGPSPNAPIEKQTLPAVQGDLMTENLATNGSGSEEKIKNSEPNVQRDISPNSLDSCGKDGGLTVVERETTESRNEKSPEKNQQAPNVYVEVKGENVAESKGGETADEKPTESPIPSGTVQTEASKPPNDPHQSPETNSETQQSSVEEAPAQVQNSMKLKPEDLKTKTNISANSDLMENQKKPASSAEIEAKIKSSTAERESEPTAAAPSNEASPLTPGEKMQQFLKPSVLRMK